MSNINICFCVDEQGIDLVPVVIDSILDKNEHNQINVHLIHNIKSGLWQNVLLITIITYAIVNQWNL